MASKSRDSKSSDAPRWLQDARDHWTHRGAERPAFAEEPGRGQESVWDYPRPPAVVPDSRRVVVEDGDGVIADAAHSIRVLETSHPPTFYVAPEFVVAGRLAPVSGSSHCEWKGIAEYVGVTGSEEPIGWRYPKPYAEFADHAGWVAFYPGRVRCLVDGEVVRPQAGGFYGGWITDDVVGPFKGDPGTSGW
ncbi:MAG: DUF427 domain-containing protein [Acidimicrobiales bacterium]